MNKYADTHEFFDLQHDDFKAPWYMPHRGQYWDHVVLIDGDGNAPAWLQQECS